jgi:hypothetical protein
MILITSKEDFKQFKSRDLVKVECTHCHCIFEREKKYIVSAINGTKGQYNFCSRKCTQSSKNIIIDVQCKECAVFFKRRPCDLKSKSGFNFCSNSCSSKYHNKHKTYGIKKSKAEIYITSLLKSNFPELIIIENDRDILPSKLEIDIYIPEIRFGIELNGPTHYLPIFGDENLKKQMDRDAIKVSEAIEQKIRLFIIDISLHKYWKTTEPYLMRIYNENIAPAILSLL